MSIPFSISDAKAKEWWDFFWDSVPEFKTMWSPNGWATTKYLPIAKQILEASQPRAMKRGGKSAFIIPIVDLKWCIKLATYSTVSITSGVAWAGTYEFSLFDFTHNKAHSFPYDRFSSVSQQGDVITLITENQKSISLSIKVPRISRTANQVGFALDVMRIVGADLASQIQLDREAKERTDNAVAADNLVGGLRVFFSQIIAKGADTFDT
jgi:hypothetical protein